jgi:predicted RNA-binding Zn-ribbon protein involved in translation (DUF1610 family)
MASTRAIEAEYQCPACAYASDNRREFNLYFCPSWPDRCAGCEVHEDRFECPECGHEWETP